MVRLILEATFVSLATGDVRRDREGSALRACGTREAREVFFPKKRHASSAGAHTAVTCLYLGIY